MKFKLLLATSLLWASTVTHAAWVVLINPFEVPAGKEQATLQYWEKAREFLKDQPGYISTKLHQSIQGGSKFRFVNVAEWESAETFQKAMIKMNQHLDPLTIKGVSFHPALYKEIRN